MELSVRKDGTKKNKNCNKKAHRDCLKTSMYRYNGCWDASIIVVKKLLYMVRKTKKQLKARLYLYISHNPLHLPNTNIVHMRIAPKNPCP